MMEAIHGGIVIMKYLYISMKPEKYAIFRYLLLIRILSILLKIPELHLKDVRKKK